MIKNDLKFLIIGLFSIAFLWSCADAPDFSDVPTLEYVGLSKLEMNQGSLNNDTLLLFLAFEDGDGDIGYESTDNATDIFLIDKRTQDTAERIKSPFVPLQGASNGIKGEMMIRIFTTCCIFPDGIPPCQAPPQFPTNELQYDIILMDRAGNKSNTVTTDIITLNCN